MSMKKLYRLYKRARIKKAIEMGLELGEGSQILDPSGLGSEPYLISIGRHVSIASGVLFITHDGATWVIREQEKYRDVIKYGRIRIHDNCMIGANAILMPGVSIGPNSVVAAGSVVYQDVPAGVIVRGNPAKVAGKVEDYAELCLASNPPYDPEAYKADKRRELLRLFPR